VPYHAASWLTGRRAANRLGQRLLAPAIRNDLERLDFLGRGRRPILIAGLPHAVDVLPFVPHQALIYHCADDYAHVRGFPSSLPELEADLCQQADLVITTSETLAESRRQFNPNTHWIPNAADIEHFSRTVAPAAELLPVPGPVIGFVGGLSEWVDIELLGHLARSRKDWSFVLIGPVGSDVASIQHLPNVRLLGARPYADLPSYLAAIDVALIPFKQDPVTYHADPITAYEYLAAGVPIVATDLPALRRLEHVVRLADSPQSFLTQIEAAVCEGRDARRAEHQAEAARHSWEDRFRQFDRLLAEVLANSARSMSA
jgi:glycosyltransferase involved in cell wall biosynthesis